MALHHKGHEVINRPLPQIIQLGSKCEDLPTDIQILYRIGFSIKIIRNSEGRYTSVEATSSGPDDRVLVGMCDSDLEIIYK